MDTKLFRSDGKTVIVALDHALASGQVVPLDQPVELLRNILPKAPDGLILTYGMQKLVPAKYAGQRWLTADYYATSVLPGGAGEIELQDRIWGVEGAKAVGATGFKALLVFGRQDAEIHLRNVRYLAKLVTEAKEANLPVMIEPVLWGSRIAPTQHNDTQMVIHAARIGFELGADVLKIPIPEDISSLESLSNALPVPIVLMGGPATDPGKLFQMLREAMDAGAAGVALGRNIWQHPQPGTMVEALRGIIHHNLSPADALDLLSSGGQA